MKIDPSSISWDFLPEKRLAVTTRLKLNDSNFQTVSKALLPELADDGWTLQESLKIKVKVRKRKPHDVAFEDRVWAAFAKLQFNSLNANRLFRLPYGEGENERKQIDVFAADDEVVLVVECKSSEKPSKQTLKSEVEAIQGTRSGIIQAVKTKFPTHKIKFVLATNNITLTEEAKTRVKNAELVHMDEETIDYYIDLADHLGKAARYQLLGALFAGMKIPELEPRVAALQSKMGGHTYYSFAIEPARLLKLGYILHRNKANSALMPTYQRLIKKPRLKSVTDFVNGGGFFPNSIIVNIDSDAHKLRFDKIAQPVGESRLGTLYLPQRYRAAYIIDGQHRLYGYGDSPRAETDLVPVVAFVDMPREDQVELFMQINENQQAVPKNLRNTLNADLLWSSPDFRKSNQALRLRIAQHLGESRTSPLFGRIIVGEDKRSVLRCITIEAVGNGLLRSSFIGTFTKNEMKVAGTFYRGANDSTFDPLVEFLELTFEFLREELPTQWGLGGADGGFVFINNGIEAITRLVGDIVLHLQESTKLNPRVQSASETFGSVKPLLSTAVTYLEELSIEQGRDLRRQYGSAGVIKYLRRLQVAVNQEFPMFLPDGFTEYLIDEAKLFNDQSASMIADIELFLKADVKKRLEDRFNARYFKDGVPPAVYTKASEQAIEKNRTLDPEDEVDPWDCLFLSDYQKIFEYKHEIWSELFAERYARPDETSKSWRAESSWMSELVRIRNENAHNHAVKEADYNFLVALTTWLAPGEAERAV